jgi:hypothetical protein
MSDFDENFWHKPARPRREIVEDAMSRLQIDQPAEAPRHVGPMEMTDEERAAFQARGMRLWRDDFVEVVGAPYPMTRVLARQLGYDVDHLPRPGEPEYTAGDDAEAQAD